MPLNSTKGVRYGDRVLATGATPILGVGEEMRGRILDALGDPIDERPSLQCTTPCSLHGAIPSAMERRPIQTVLPTGVRVLDAMLTVGRGQRVGIFGGSGVGKSTLIGMMTRNTTADLTVVGLVGERGREVREFVEGALSDAGRERSVLLVATSDQSPLMRMRAAMAATTVAEFHAARGKHVLLVLDSLTRYAMAAREVGLAAGEPPATKGYTPSVFTHLAKLLERAGNFEHGSITAFYTVLMEGDDQQDPIVDAARSLLDGHVVLSREMASEGWFPPVNLLDSISRLMPAVASPEHLRRAATIRRLLALQARSADLVRIGAYKAGADAELDRALRALPAIRQFLEQSTAESAGFDEIMEQLAALERAL
jgi:flagellum-specific ATP synthase